jgi:hypothetical protein
VTSLLDRLDAIYRAVKRKRRSLCLVSLGDLAKQDYVNEMSKLSEDKEDVEKLWRDIEALEPLVGGTESGETVCEEYGEVPKCS